MPFCIFLPIIVYPLCDGMMKVTNDSCFFFFLNYNRTDQNAFTLFSKPYKFVYPKCRYINVDIKLLPIFCNPKF